MRFATRTSRLASLAGFILTAAACSSSSSTTQTTHAISGTVTRAICATGAGCLVPVAGATVRLGGAATASATTDAAGAYAFAGLADATYTVTPSLDGYQFTPSAPSVVLTGANQVQDFTAASAIAAYRISGTVSYAGSATGRVYLTVVPSGCTSCSGVAGTSLAAPGAYAIQGVTPGSYHVLARRDVLGRGQKNASDPVGMTAAPVMVTTANATGADVALVDPTAPTPGLPSSAPNLIPGKNGMLIFWTPDRDASGIEKATAYDISWGTDAAASNLAMISGVPALDDGSYLQGGLTDATTYYYKLRSRVGAAQSGWSPIASATAGAAGGGFTVSGSVTFGVTASGPLLVAIGDPGSGNMRVAAYPTPGSSPAAFSVTGVPAGAATIYAVLDQNANGVIDDGDLKNVNAWDAPIVDVAGDTSGVVVPLSSARGSARTATGHDRPVIGVDGYTVQDTVGDGVSRAVKVTVLSGKHLPVPLDLPREQQVHYALAFLGAAAPAVGDTYRHEVLYADGVTETPASAVTVVLDSFAQGLTASTAAPGSVGAPFFSWSAPATPPAGTWGYAVSLWGGAGASWDYPRDARMVASTTTSVLYNADGSATPASLTTGTYTWAVTVVDAAGNAARLQKEYVVP